MTKQFWAVILAVVVILGGITVLGNRNDQTDTSSVKPTSHIIGEGEKNVTLVEYGDYQCPACGYYHPILKQVMEKYSKEIYFQFRNFPLTQLHPNAFAAARAAEAASLQNKFWEMHDMLYENQDAWSAASDPLSFFNQYAQTIKLDSTKFKQDYASGKVNALINADMKEGSKLNLSGTPSFIINGKQIDNTKLSSVDDLYKIIDAAIKDAPKTTDNKN